MSPVPAENAPPPIEVFAEFLHALQRVVTPEDRLVPVLRGSILMQRWFPDAARPAADIDLEWFPLPGWESRFSSVDAHARGLCMLALMNHEESSIEFDSEVPMPEASASLWEYDMPGSRCFTGWTVKEHGTGGLLQVDLARATSYELTDIVTEPIELPRAHGEPARALAYGREMLLAAKLSWILRCVHRYETAARKSCLTVLAEPKDLFDADLLLRQGDIRRDALQRAFRAVALADKIDRNQLGLLLDRNLTLPEEDKAFPKWAAFSDQHRSLVRCAPTVMLATIIERLRPLFEAT